MENQIEDLNKNLENLKIAIENAREQCAIALNEINKLRALNEAEAMIKPFDEFVRSLVMGK